MLAHKVTERDDANHLIVIDYRNPSNRLFSHELLDLINVVGGREGRQVGARGRQRMTDRLLDTAAETVLDSSRATLLVCGSQGT